MTHPLRLHLQSLLLGLLLPALAHGQTFHWVGGSGDWGDASHWSATPDGPGGAGVPRQGDPVLLAPLERTTITIGRTAWCGGLRISGDAAPVMITGATIAELRVHGGLELSGEVRWDLPGALRFGGTAEGMPIDAGNVVIGSDVVFDGSGSWSLSCDLELAGDRDLLLEKGTLVTNGARMTARSIRKIGRGPQRAVIGSSVLQLREALLPELMSVLDMGNALQLVNGTPVPMATTMADGPERGITVCGTGPGQTQFVVDAQLVSDYNGFGVSCKGVCDGVVTATVTGGVGPFTYQWVGGPTTATWNNVCAGNQIVIVTDQGQSVSCAATVNVSDPALLSVIFFGVVPPACADVCDGSAQGIAVGGSGSYNYLWNGGQETGPAAFQLCAGPNTLEVTDANNCLFDTTFFLNVTPIEPNLSFTDATCFGGCDGTADVAPVGGTGVYSFLWAPAPPSGQGTPSVSGLCAGPWTVTVTDGNGCDTTVAFTINEPAPIEPNPSQVDASCGDVCDGSATVGPTGSPGPFSYFWDPPPPAGQGTEQATQLCAGTWNVTITDDGTGCDTTVQFIIDAPPVIDPVPTFTDASCSDLCDGTASVTPVGGTTPFTFLWTPSPPVGQGTGSVSGLCPGVWQVLIADAIGCDTTVEFVIGAPPSLDVNGLVTDATCANDCDGAIDVTVSGGTPGYGFTWSPAPPAGQGTPNVSGLCAGDWGVTVSDANGCDTTLIFTVNAPPPLDAQVLVNDATCGGNCDGTASAQVNGGTGPYTYLWTPAPPFGQGTDSVAGLCAGAWSLLITDVNGCDTTLNFQVDEPPALQVQFSVTDATCPSNCDGEAEATVSGGTLPYTFLWTPAPGAGQGTSLATGLCPGNYTLLITDALGCDTLVDFTIGAPPPIVPNATVTDATCSDVCDGSIVLAPSGGTPPFTFLWSPVPPNGQGQAEATGLCPGDWTVTITAIGGCDTTLTLTIGAPPALEVQLTTLDATCSGDCDGTAEAVVTGGTPGYSYLWSPAPGSGQGTPDAGGLCAGNYTLTVTDQVGCDTVLAFTISEPSPLDPQLSITDSGCGACDGVAVVDTVGGSGPHTFLWTPAPPQGQGTDSVSGLCPGLWEVLITDANGCDTLVAFTINTPSGIDALPAITDASCADVCDGAIDLTTTGGVPPYDFTWTPPPPVGQGTANVAGLCPGQWSVQIGDQAGCDTVLVFVVGAPPPLDPVPTVTNESCNGPCDGSATVSPVGGSGNYAFLWSPNPPQGQGTATASELCAGDWTITITDQVSGCDTTLTLTILPQQPIDPGLQALDATCWNICNGTATVSPTGGVGPYTYLWSPSPPFGQGTDSVAQLCQGLWQVTVTDALGCDTIVNFTITKPLPVVSSLSIQSETCDGPCTGAAAVFPFGGTGVYTFNWQPPPGGGQGTFFATGLCAGTSYSITITDSLGCDTTETFTVDPFIPITPNLSTEPPTCAGQCDGSATVGPVGGIAPYTYDWTPDPPNGDSTAQALGLCAGVYTVLITDDLGCDTLISVLITEPDTLTLDAVVQNASCGGGCDGSIVVTPQGGTGPFSFNWSPVPPNGDGSNGAFGLCAGDWAVTVVDANGCDTTVTWTITEPPLLLLGTSVVQSECQLCNGQASVQPAGGSPPYGFLWFDDQGNLLDNDSLLTGLCAGLFTVVVTDAGGCSDSALVAVTDSDGELLSTTDGSTTCWNTCDGQVSVSYLCSDPPCLTAWYDGNGTPLGVTDTVATGLCQGVYLVEVTNATGCLSIDTATVVSPPELVPNLSSSPVSCAGECDGSATVGPTGGVGPYTFDWTPDPPNGDGTPQALGLCPGVYTVLIADALGCDSLVSVLITEPDTLTATAVVEQVSCAGSCDGSIVVSPQGGTGPYTFSWTPVPPNGDGSNGAFSLCPGIWSVSVADANGCDTLLTYSITEPAPLAVNVITTPSQCGVCVGTADVVVSGGTAPYELTWTDANGLPVSDSTFVDGLCAGLYTLVITDAIACESDTLVVPITDSDGEVLTTTDGATGCANTCDAQVSVSFTCSLPPCTVLWTDLAGDTLAVDELVLDSLCTGDYLVQVSNAAGCISIDTATVIPGTTITPNLSSTPVSCAGQCDGSATVGPVGGIAPYTYDWTPDPPNGDSTAQALGLCAGVYTVLITDDLGCDTLISVLITEPDTLTLDAVVQNASCGGGCDGSIVVTPQGGTGPFSFNWSPVPPNGDGSNGAFGLCAGDWAVTVVDANGCDTTVTWTITEPPLLLLGTSVVQSECQLCNGQASVQPAGGSPPYGFLWFDDQGNLLDNDSLLTGLCAGLFTVVVTDAGGCSDSALVAVTDSDGELLSTTDGSTTCWNTCDGQVSVSYLCSDPPCLTAWYDGNGTPLGVTDTVATGLCQGVYLVEVTNATGCLSIDTATVVSPPELVPNLSSSPVSCAGECDGSATVGPTGGVGPYTFDWTPDPPNGDGTPQALGLCPGVYTVLIADALGCDSLVSVLITEPDTLTATAVVEQVSCAGSCDGSIVVSPQGGTGPYTFSWTPVPPNGDGSNGAFSLCPGIWSVSVADANSCDTTYSWTITQPDSIAIGITITDNECFGDCAGSVTIVVQGGVPPYGIVWTDANGVVLATDTTFLGGLCAGVHTITVTDSIGCVAQANAFVDEAPAIDAGLVVVGETCNGPCDGTATASPTGGTGGYTYLWQPNPPIGQGTAQVAGLCVGNWSVTITDGLGCDTTVAFTIDPYQPIDPQESLTPVTCNGDCDGSIVLDPQGGIGSFTYLWTPTPPNGATDSLATGLCAGDWTATVTDGVGCDTTLTWTITEPPALVLVVDSVMDASCSTAQDGAIYVSVSGGSPGYTILWTGPGFSSGQEDITGLIPGTYVLVVADTSNCSDSLVVTVQALATVVADAGPDVNACEGSVIVLDGSSSVGAGQFEWAEPGGPVLGNGPQLTLSGSGSGTYDYVLTVSDGICSDQDTVSVTVLGGPFADAGEDQTIFLDETAVLGGAPTGPPGSTYGWAPDSLVGDPTSANPVADPPVTTWFVVTVTASNGCTSIDSVLVTVIPEVVIPTGFTPNGDGYNDTWVIDFVELFPDIEVEIYNRWGELLFRSVGYQQPWDGRYEGGLVPVGTYYYVVVLNDPDFPEPFTGPLTVIR